LKISYVSIRNFRSIKDIEITPFDICAFIGQNNAGKSNILHAIDLFFNPSVQKITRESFYSDKPNLGDPTEPIEITIHFARLNEWERAYFADYVDGEALKVKRRILWNGGDAKIEHVGIGSCPSVEWLRTDVVKGERIESWWEKKEKLTVDGLDFIPYLPSHKPGVGEWKEAIAKFLSDHKGEIAMQEVERPNISGYDNVLKGGLPHCVLVHAVSDILDNIKVTKTGPFGQLINYVLESIPQEKKTLLEGSLENFRKLLVKREDSDERFDEIKKLEQRMNELLKPLTNCALEIRPTIPSLDEVFGAVDMFANDGLNTPIAAKGHGLQRYVIFTILRAYVEFRREGAAGRPKDRTMLLLIEEPELYLHPQAQRALIQLLRVIASTKDQVMYSTHSSLFIDMKNFEEICLVKRNQLAMGFMTQVTALSAQAMVDDLKTRCPETNPTPQSIKERYSHVYNPSRNEGFFADKIVIVEGQTEEYALPLYADALGFDFDRDNVSVVGAGGKGIIDRLYRIFNEFRIPCYIVFDGDRNNHDPDVKKQTRFLMRLMKQQDTVPDRTIFHTQFTVFANRWEDEIAACVPNYGELVRKAREELGLEENSGKPLISRYIALDLVAKGVEEGDPAKYVPPFIMKICDRIRQLQWSGTILVQPSSAS
jgi:predicted ATP-dependent endonuclease of OLD family